MPTARTRLTPRAVAAEVVRRLADAADPTVARQSATYFKDAAGFVAYGVRTAQVRALSRDAFARVRDAWSVADATACCELLSARPQFEAKAAGVLLLGRYRRTFPAGLLQTVRHWVLEERFANWAAVDLASCELLTPLVERRDSAARIVRGWARSRQRWLRRAAAVTFVPLARAGKRLDDAYAVVVALRGDGEDLSHKASGWLLREAGKTDPARLERFLLAHGPTLPRTTVRYAIERFPSAHRARLLRATRA